MHSHPSETHAPSTVIEASVENFQQDVLERSTSTPVLLDFWATWCGPCKTLGPILEKLAAEYNGGFILAKVDVDAQQQLAAYFQIRSVPTVLLFKGGQPIDGFPGVISETQLRQFLAQHGIEPLQLAEPEETAPATAEEIIAKLRQDLAEQPDNAERSLELGLALARYGDTEEAKKLISALPANFATDDRALNANVLISNAAYLKDAPPRNELENTVANEPNNLSARHLLGLRLLGDGEAQAALDQFLEMLRQDKNFQEGLPRKALIEAFNVLTDTELVSQNRRKMAALLF